MESSLLTQAGQFLAAAALVIKLLARYVYTTIVVAIVALLVLRWLVDALKLSPFGRFAYHARRPGNEMIFKMKNSPFYFPLKRSLGFDPAILMVLIATAIFCYLVSIIIDYLTTLLNGLGSALYAFGSGSLGTGLWILTGIVLLGIVFYLLTLMTIIFINWIFGWFGKMAYWSMERIRPLLRVFEFGGALAGLSFLLLGIALQLVAVAIERVFQL
ncbi:MAG TPA: hypothetical protein VFD58_04510 [Blastocatellia bacterium]|nr:hypothetical protein [Blastocatellia bacterium]